MRIWYDACTGKQIRYGAAIAKRLRACGHDVVLTTRRHPDTTPLAKLLGENFVAVGKYDPTSPLSRLREGAKRQLLFCRMFEANPPNVAISHRSVELCRVAFGLGIPIISTHDTPHAEAVNRLTMPLIDVLVVSKSIPEHRVQGYGIEAIERFDGVDEVAWIKGFKPKVKYGFGKPLIVVRHQETKAAYALGETDLTETLARKLSSLGEVVFLSRYDRRPKKNLIVPKDFVDSASLVAQADLVVGVGGTTQREAALLGTPSIVIPITRRIYVNDYLLKRGFPIFTVAPSKAIHYARKLLGKRQNVKGLLAKLENPLDVIQDILRRRVFSG